MKFLITFFLCTLCVAQNSAIIVLANGAEVAIAESRPVTLAPRVVATLERDNIRIRNGGDPDRWNTTAWIPAPFYWQQIKVTCPERRPEFWPMDLSRPGTADNEWVLSPFDAPKHAHHEADDPAQPWYAPSKQFHMIDGGDTFYARLTTYDDPYELTSITLAQRQQALAVANLDVTLTKRWPLAQRVIDLYRFDASSLDPAASPRNYGWFLMPDLFVSKFTSWNIELCRGWYAWPDHQLPGDGICNAHYGHDAHWLENFLLTGDGLSKSIGLALVRQKCATGLIDIDRAYPSCRYSGMWRGEKAATGRRGGPLGSQRMKEWDEGTLIAHIFEPNDALISRGVAVRRTNLLSVNPADVWNGAGGGRQAGAYLRNLRDHFIASGDVLFKQKAAVFIDHVWKVRDAQAATWNAAHPDRPMLWFPNIYDLTHVAAWEEATLHQQLYWWATQGVGTSRLTDVDASMDWMIRKASGPRGSEYQVAYSVDVLNETFTSNSPTNCLWWVPLVPTIKARLPQHSAAADAWTSTAYTRIGQTWSQIDAGAQPLTASKLGVDSGPEGPGALKLRAYVALSIRK